MGFQGPIGLTLAAVYLMHRLVLDNTRSPRLPKLGATRSGGAIGHRNPDSRRNTFCIGIRYPD